MAGFCILTNWHKLNIIETTRLCRQGLLMREKPRLLLKANSFKFTNSSYLPFLNIGCAMGNNKLNIRRNQNQTIGMETFYCRCGVILDYNLRFFPNGERIPLHNQRYSWKWNIRHLHGILSEVDKVLSKSVKLVGSSSSAFRLETNKTSQKSTVWKLNICERPEKPRPILFLIQIYNTFAKMFMSEIITKIS